MNLAAHDAFYTQDLYDVARASGYRTGLAGKNHTYRKAKSLDFWREYSHVSGHKEPNADPRYAAFDAWMKQLGAGSLSLEPTPFPAEVQYPYRSEEQPSDLQSIMRISYAVFCLKKKKTSQQN